jgi:hypothetical protein
MTQQTAQSKAEARRERGSEANHLSMDTAAAGLAGGLGLALLHQPTSEAAAAAIEARSFPVPVGDRAIDGQPDRDSAHGQVIHDHQSERPSAMSHSDAGGGAGPDLEVTAPIDDAGTRNDLQRASTSHSDSGMLESSVGQAGASIPISTDHQELGHSETGSLQHLISGTSSAMSNLAQGLEHKLDKLTSATSDAIDASLNAMSQQLSSLASHLGDLVADRGESLSQTVTATTGMAGDLASSASSAVPAVVDPIFHQAFGPASDIHSLGEGVVDTGGLATFGTAAYDAPIAFVGQSYADIADHTVHGLQGLTHGLV